MSDAPLPYSAAKACARLGGLSYVMLAAGGIFGGFIAIASQVVPGDAPATAVNISEAGALYRYGVLAWVITIVLDLVVAWALYVVTRPAGSQLPLLMAWSRVVYIAIHGAAITQLALAQKFASGANFLSVFSIDQLAAFTSLALVAHKTGFQIALIFFGLHLVLLAVLMVRAPYLPSLVGVLVAISGLVYVGDAIAYIGMADYDAYAGYFVAAVSIAAIVAELGLAGFLLLVGVGTKYPYADRTEGAGD